MYKKVYIVGEQGQTVSLLHLLLTQDFRRPWANTDFISLPHFAAIMFSMPAALPDNLLSVEKLENSSQRFTETLHPAQPTL